MLNFCTYFDYNYIQKARVCYHTIMKYGPVMLYCLCFDDRSYNEFKDKDNVIAFKIEDLENYRPSLLSLKAKRWGKEYYATVTPVVPLFLFDKYNINILFYTDADMAFWSDPNEIAEVMGDHSLMVTQHENKVAHAAGYFNVGILGYRNDSHCRKFLSWWEERCIEWCEWKAPRPGLCADQGYLNILYDEPDKFKNTLVSPHPGINIGPWNLAMHKLSSQNGKLLLDDKYNLICYHYHGYDDGKLNNTGWNISEERKQLLYVPYRAMLRNIK